MIITEEILALISKAPFIPIVTLSDKAEPHLIVVGGVKETREDDTLAFGIYKMQKTQQNIKDNGFMQVVIATMEGSAKGYRLTGKASIDGQVVIFKAGKADALI